MRSSRYRPSPHSPQPRRFSPRVGAASLVLVGLIIGLLSALYYAWIEEPVIYVAASPARLNEEYKAEYILLVSQSYAATGDWELTQQRLAALDDPEVANTVALQLENYLRTGKPASVMRNLAILARRLGVNNTAVAFFDPQTVGTITPSPTVQNATPTSTLIPSPTVTRKPTSSPRPTLTPTSRPSPTLVPIYRLLRQEQVCEPRKPASRIEVVVLDAFLEPAPGVEAIIDWEAGRDHLITGFKPELGLGYGDFDMEPGISYSVFLADGSPTVSGLRVETCIEAEGGLAGGWRLTFQNTDVPQETPEPDG
jgi:hypothetical protein